jgi:integrase
MKREVTRSRKKLERGIWIRDGRYIVGYMGADGQWHTKTVDAKTLTQARAERERLRVGTRAGTVPAPSRATLHDVWLDYESMLEGKVATGELEDNTLEERRRRYRVHIQSQLGRRELQKLRGDHVSRWLSERRRNGSCVFESFVLLKQLLERACTQGRLHPNPLDRLTDDEKPKPGPKTEPRRLTDEECKRLIASASPSMRVLVAMLVHTGMRQSEALGLRWLDADFAEKLIHVRRQLARKKRGKPAQTKGTKSMAGVRQVEVLDELLTLLRAHKAQAFERGYARPEDYVFATSDGKPLLHRNVARDFSKAAKRAGLNPEGVQPLSCHDLRHTHTSRLIALGYDIVSVAQQIGDTVATIHKFYAGDFERAKRRTEMRKKLARSGLGAQ